MSQLALANPPLPPKRAQPHPSPPTSPVPTHRLGVFRDNGVSVPRPVRIDVLHSLRCRPDRLHLSNNTHAPVSLINPQFTRALHANGQVSVRGCAIGLHHFPPNPGFTC